MVLEERISNLKYTNLRYTHREASETPEFT